MSRDVAVALTAVTLAAYGCYRAVALRWVARTPWLTGSRNKEPLIRATAERLVGCLLLGVAPLGVVLAFGVPLARVGALLPDLRTVGPMTVVAGCTLMICWLLARIPAVAARHPTTQLRRWSPVDWVLEGSGWLLYLLAYELCFRGILLGAVASLLSPVRAGVAVTVLYALVHLEKGPQEVAGSLVVGSAWAWLSLSHGSILWPWLVHAIFAIGMQVLCWRRRHPVRVE